MRRTQRSVTAELWTWCNDGAVGLGGTKTMFRERTRLWLWLELRKDNGIDYGTMELAADYDRDYEL